MVATSSSARRGMLPRVDDEHALVGHEKRVVRFLVVILKVEPGRDFGDLERDLLLLDLAGAGRRAVNHRGREAEHETEDEHAQKTGSFFHENSRRPAIHARFAQSKHRRHHASIIRRQPIIVPQPMAIALVLTPLAASVVRHHQRLSHRSRRCSRSSLGAGPLQTGMLFALWGLFPLVLSVYAGRARRSFRQPAAHVVRAHRFHSEPRSLRMHGRRLPALYRLGGDRRLRRPCCSSSRPRISWACFRPRRCARATSAIYSLGESAAAIAGPVLVGYWIDTLRSPAHVSRSSRS